jgi:hypothetical protein
MELGKALLWLRRLITSLSAEARVRARVGPYGICGGQSGTWAGFSPTSSVLPCQCHSTMALQTCVSGGRTHACCWLQFRDIILSH